MTTTPLRPAAFTLFELVAALAIAALLASVAFAALGPRTQPARERQTLDEVVLALITARTQAMQGAEPARALIEQEAARPNEPAPPIVVTAGGREREIDAHGLRLSGEDADPIASVLVVFDHAGRTHARAIRFLSDGTRRRDVLSSGVLRRDDPRNPDPLFEDRRGARGGELRSGRVWTIALDPVSGSPALRAHGAGPAAFANPSQTSRNGEKTR